MTTRESNATSRLGMLEESLSRIENDLQALVDRIASSRRLVVLTGAGCSTGSGIPDYRDDRGQWKRKEPVRYQQFVGSAEIRKRYWARSMVGWRLVERARPNAAHQALAALELSGHVHYLITQNVDGLHQKAGSVCVNDLHGRIGRVCCLGCGARTSRTEFQDRLCDANRDFRDLEASFAPDGDSDLEDVDITSFHTPACPGCAGILKPDVVFFGESVPRERVEDAMAQVDAADLLLVVGSSLMVWSGYRFVKRARDGGVTVAAINLGVTRADDEIDVKLRAECGEALGRILRTVSPPNLKPAAASG